MWDLAVNRFGGLWGGGVGTRCWTSGNALADEYCAKAGADTEFLAHISLPSLSSFTRVFPLTFTGNFKSSATYVLSPLPSVPPHATFPAAMWLMGAGAGTGTTRVLVR